MFRINVEKIISNNGKCNIPYFCGNCSTCENFKENEICKKKELINVISHGIQKMIYKKICKNWLLYQQIINCFKQQNNGYVKQPTNEIGFTKVKYKDKIIKHY